MRRQKIQLTTCMKYLIGVAYKAKHKTYVCVLVYRH